MEMRRTLTILCLMAGLIPAWSSRNSRSAEEDLGHLASCIDSASVNDFCNNNRGICVEPEDSNSCTKRTSQNSGKRSNAPCELKCQQGEPCIELPDVPNGNAVLVEEDYSSLSALAIIECDRGFEIEGTVLIKCTRYQNWTEPSDQCKPIVCNPLPLVANGEYGNPTGNTVDSTATLICDEGYEADGDPDITCQLSSCWSEVNATCKPIPCENFPSVPNGDAELLEACQGSFGDLAQIVCNSGFEITGTVLITCESNQMWTTPDQQCQPIECGDLPMVVNGNFQSSNSFVDTVATLNCDTGYEASGNTTVTCQLSSCWSKVQATCEPTPCTNLPHLANGGAELLEAGQGSFGDLAQIVCNSGFEITGTVLITCESNQMWTTPDQQCQAIECGDLPMVVNGNFQSSDSFVDTVATLNCEQGYMTFGNPTVTCQLSSCWSKVQATCEPTPCENFPNVPNGYVELLEAGQSAFGDLSQIVCLYGFEITGTVIITCESNQMWTTPDQECQAIECGDFPLVENGIYQSGDRFVDTVATLNCEQGYVVSGDPTITCQLSSCWSTVQATCEPISCGVPLPTITNGQMELVIATNADVGAQAVAVCDKDYFPSQFVIESVCQTDGYWSAPLGTCDKLFCNDATLPYVPNGGYVPFSDSSYKTVAVLECDPGFEPIGTGLIFCGCDGIWGSDSVSTCVLVG